MVGTTCFVPGCKTGYKSHRKEYSKGKHYPSMFGAPRDPVLLKMWEIAIRRKDRQLSRADAVCELHFQDDDIERFYVTKLADGNIHKMERGRSTLKHGVVPSIFPDHRITVIKNLPKMNTVDNSSVSLHPKNKNTHSINTVSEYSLEASSDENQTCKSDFKAFCKTIKEPEDVNLIQNNFDSIISNVNNDNTNFHVNLEESFSYKNLCERLIMIQKPSDWWCITTTSEYVVCARWNLKHIAEKTIIIDENLSAKVYLREREIVIPDLTKVASIDDVSALIRRIEGFKVCAGVNRFKDCIVCLLVGKEMGKKGRIRKWCNPCRISIKKEINAKRKQSRITKPEKQENKTMKLVCEKRKNLRLLNKVNKLRRRLQIYEKICPSVKSEVNKLSSMFITTESAQIPINTANLEDEDISGDFDCELL